MDLIRHDDDIMLLPSGFKNIGSTCYFNAMLQGILSCTSFSNEILREFDQLNDEDKTKNKKTKAKKTNPLLPLFYKLVTRSLPPEDNIEEGEKNKQDVSKYSGNIWKNMIVYLMKVKNINMRDFMSGQQCTREGFHYLLESLDDFKSIQDLFSHRYQTNIYCPTCEKWVSKKECNNCI